MPETEQDVLDLVMRLRGHVHRLGAAVPTDEPALGTARRLSARPLPDGYVASRVHLRQLALAVRELIATARQSEHGASPGWSPWRPGRNIARAAVFVTALVVLVVAASVPRV
ncbi:DUF6415 family natural product biosynthesis protein [Streptomyces sp. NPDC005012]|uniref:DUF6415 family natural product biosynthesis protein n=1 Tax=Streptomyces sp. NPDC005012 TaxID=3154558 RepID=UPI0033A5C2DB